MIGKIMQDLHQINESAVFASHIIYDLMQGVGISLPDRKSMTNDELIRTTHPAELLLILKERVCNSNARTGNYKPREELEIFKTKGELV